MTKSEIKNQAIAILTDNIEIDFPTLCTSVGGQISLRSFYNYRNQVLGVVAVEKKKNATVTELNNIVEIEFLQNAEMEKLQNDIEILKNTNNVLQNDIAFHTQEAENQAVANASFGYYAIRFLIAIILIGNFANVYNGIASIESSGFLAILLCTIFATSGFCIMLVQNASAKLKLGVSAICILWESVFASGSIYSNVYKSQNEYAKIIDLLSNCFNGEPKSIAIYFAILLSLTICGILYTAIYLITKKS